MDMPFMEGDMTLLSIFGSAVPLIATRTRPHGPVKITESTVVQVMSEPTPEKKGIQLSRTRTLVGCIVRSRESEKWSSSHCVIPNSSSDSESNRQRASFYTDHRAAGRLCWQRPWPTSRTRTSTSYLGPRLCQSSTVSQRLACERYSRKPRKLLLV